MPEQLGFTRLLNHLFGGLAASAMHLFGVQADPATAIDNTFALEVLVVLGLIVFFVLVRMSLSVESPNALQQVAEMIHEFTGTQGEQVIGHDHERFQAFVTCILLFVLFNNFLGLLMGLVPNLVTPTSQPLVPFGIAVLTFVYYNYHGLRVHKLGYAKQFAGPVWWLIPLMVPVEIVSHLARMMSLTIRLYANMLASDLLTLICFSIMPILAPTIFLGLHFAVSIVQAYVFMLLSMIYLSMAVSHEH